MKKKHILIIPSWYPEKAGDVGGSFFREQAIALQKRGYKVGVIAPMLRSARDVNGLFTKPYGARYQNDEGVDTCRYHAINIPKLPRLARERWVAIGLKLYNQYVKCHGTPDLIHVHSMLHGGFLAYSIKKKFNTPYVITEHSSAFSRNLVSKEILQELKPIIESSSCNIAVSNRFAKLLDDKTGVEKWIYVPNIASDDFLTHEVDPLEGGFKFINICLLNKNKKIDVLIRSFANSFKGNKSVTLIIGGDGPERTYLEQLAKELGVDEQVSFLGMLTRDRVKHEVAKSNAFVLSSEYETFGVVVVEALALGKPVIATKCGGPESIVTDEVGYLVDVNNVKEMSTAMVRLYRNKNNFDSEEIRQYCKDNFSEDAVINKLNTIYSSVLDEK